MSRAITRGAFTLLLAAAAVGSAACGDRESVQVQFSADGTEPTPTEDGEVKITSTDGALVLAVVRDSVLVQLSDSLRASVRDSVRAGMDSAGDQVGAFIGNMVGTVVNSALGFTVRVPATAVENLRYENGELRFDVRGGNVKLNSGKNTNSNGGTFTPEDAERFIIAVEEAKARQRTRNP